MECGLSGQFHAARGTLFRHSQTVPYAHLAEDVAALCGHQPLVLLHHLSCKHKQKERSGEETRPELQQLTESKQTGHLSVFLGLGGGRGAGAGPAARRLCGEQRRDTDTGAPRPFSWTSTVTEFPRTVCFTTTTSSSTLHTSTSEDSSVRSIVRSAIPGVAADRCLRRFVCCA